ncbi:small hydrophilic protein [Amycolatopsis sp. YIM 10]|uniref:small hydrophilic protein n=1 Tax=Amycolatopsis sp. YIM 10 TaxID=2653857 RepID=UPI00129071C1|nr:small hydrophilic protein [Amycolatopsis sp. YIM 10]QFU93357.1 hypothetical protein YIM_41100 [Amycolatopsis sp. YIM 10]
MTKGPRLLALIAVLALPVGAAIVLLLLADPEPPKEPATVRIGESATFAPPPPSATPVPPSTSAAPSDTWLPPPPPVDDDDLDDDNDDDD